MMSRGSRTKVVSAAAETVRALGGEVASDALMEAAPAVVAAPVTEMEAETVELGGALARNVGVTAQQERAMGLMAVGRSIAEVASAVGVNRGTIYRWMKEDQKFVAAYNLWRREQKRAVQRRLLSACEAAAEVVVAQIQRGDAKLAAQLLKGMGVMKEEKDGPVDPGEVEFGMAIGEE
jgi:hypothetical protein